MPLSDAEKKAMIATTHGIAWNMSEDFKHIRELLAKPQPTAAEIRRLSNVLRRLLIDAGGDLQKISPPRLAKRIYVPLPDLKQAVKETNAEKLYFCSLGVSGIFGSEVEHFAMSAKPGPVRQMTLYGSKRSIQIPTEPISLTLDGMLNQPVLYFEGQWFNRREIIKYVANVAGGVHSGESGSPKDESLNRVRQLASFYSEKDGELSLRFYTTPLFGSEDKSWVNRFGVDLIMVQVLAAARYLARAPDVMALETIVAAEAS